MKALFPLLLILAACAPKQQVAVQMPQPKYDHLPSVHFCAEHPRQVRALLCMDGTP